MRGSLNMFTKLTQKKEWGLGKRWHCWRREEGGLGKCWQWLTKEGGGAWAPPIFGWHNLGTAPYQISYCRKGNSIVLLLLLMRPLHALGNLSRFGLLWYFGDFFSPMIHNFFYKLIFFINFCIFNCFMFFFLFYFFFKNIYINIEIFTKENRKQKEKNLHAQIYLFCSRKPQNRFGVHSQHNISYSLSFIWPSRSILSP